MYTIGEHNALIERSHLLAVDLHQHLGAIASEIDFPALVRSDPSLRLPTKEEKLPWQALPHDLDDYSLIGINAKDHSKPYNLLTHTQYDLPQGVRADYKGGKPMLLEGGAVLGIVWKGLLCAVGSANVLQGGIRLEQLQNVVKSPYYGPKLGGFRWNDALVEAWRNIACDKEVAHLTIVSAQNNFNARFYGDSVLSAFRRAYDDVAERRKFVADDSGNWRWIPGTV